MRLCPWADIVYGCDGPWWRSRHGLPDYSGIKLSNDTAVCATYRDVHKVEVADHDLVLFDEPGVIGSGGNSGFQALNLAAQFGAHKILLIGFDMHGADGAHWYGHNSWKNANNPTDHNYVRWRAAFRKQAVVLARMGIEIINGSASSALTCFRYGSVEETMAAWGV